MKEIKNLSLNKVLSLTFLSLSFFIIPMQSQAEEITNQRSAEAQSAFEQAEKYRTTTNNYRAILRWYKKAAKLDHAEAQFQLWRIYEYALFGKKKNLREAQKWLFEAAKNDHPKAKLKRDERSAVWEVWKQRKLELAMSKSLAEIVKEKRRVAKKEFELAEKYIKEKNFKEAIPLLKNLAYSKYKQYAPARFLLAKAYQHGVSIEGIEKNPQIARGLFLQAAEQGHPEAQFIVANVYESPDVEELNFGKKDLDKAIDWYTKAAKQGHIQAFENLKSLIENYSLAGKCYQSFAGS